MKMTIDEIIAKETEIAQEFQEIIATHIVSGNFSLEELYCDDTEVIEEELKRCKELFDYHSTIADTMLKYQKIQKIVQDDWDKGYQHSETLHRIKEAIGESHIHWIDDEHSYICPKCGFIVANPNHFIGRRCPQCGFQDEKDKEDKNVK